MAQTRLGNIRKCKFQLWAFSAEAPGNGNIVVHSVITRVMPPAGDQYLDTAGHVRLQWGRPATSKKWGFPSQPPCLRARVDGGESWCFLSALFTWDRESRDKIHKPILAVNFRYLSSFHLCMFVRATLQSKIDALIFTSTLLCRVDVGKMAKRWMGGATLNIL